jgi:hypothetical protein
MTTMDDLGCVDERGRPVKCDAFGNSIAFACPRCTHPMLAITRPKQRGSSPQKPALCRKCRYACWVEAGRDTLKLYTLST